MTDPETVAVICRILTDLLGAGTVDPGCGFRELGGDSLRAIKAAGQIAVEFGTPDTTNERLLEALLDGAPATALARLVEEPGLPSSPEMPVHGEHGGRTLSYGEERLWLAQRYYPDAAAYHVVNAFRVTGDLDLAALDRAFYMLVDRHPALRTRYDDRTPRTIGDVPASRGHAGGADVVHSQEALPWDAALTAATTAATAPFDLSRGQLLRVRSYPTADGARLLLVVIHHIATDGWSMELLYAELDRLYAGLPAGPAPPGYGEFAAWQRSSGLPLATAEALAARLGALPDRLELTGGRRRPPVRSMAGEVLRTSLTAAATSRLRTLAQESGASLYAVLLAAFYLCLGRRSRQWDQLVGAVASGRTQPRFHETVGFFASTLPVRVTAGPDTRIGDLIGALSAEMRWLLAHQQVQLEELALRARQTPDRAHGPLVDAVLVLQDDAAVLPELADCTVRPVPLHTGTAKFDLMLEVSPAGKNGDLSLSWEYATDLLDGDDVAGLAAAFGEITAALPEPGATVRSVTGLTAAERRLVRSSSGVSRTWPGLMVAEQFERLARAGPALPAVIDGTTVTTRAELSDLRDRVAGSLIARGVRPGDVVAIHLPRSPRSVAAMLAAWWIGAVPVFADIHHPAEHRDTLVRACQPAVVLSRDSTSWPPGITVLRWTDAIRSAAPPGPLVPRSPDDPAWLVATSGSTGMPKLAVGTHAALRNRCAWAWECFPYRPAEVVALRTPLGFVDAIAEAAVPLLAGVPLAMVPDQAVWDARDLAGVLGRHKVTRLLGTPSILRHLLDAVLDQGAVAPDLRWCISSGEPLDAELVGRLREALPACRLINLYGCSEVAGDATYMDVTELPAGRPVPIGRPIANTTVLVADAHGEPVPPGTVGELVVSGDPVGLGYLIEGTLTPSGGFRTAPGGGRGYWTGDLGWLGLDGYVYFAGRRDRQVKVRGCRVELDQVEAVVRDLPGVRQAVAWVDRGPDGGDRIFAAAVPVAGAVLLADGLRERLREMLPSYMVPAQIITATALPLGASGKLEHAEASRLAARPGAGLGEIHDLYPAQRRLQLLWSSALGGVVAGIDDDFFALGGDSLAANSMLAAVTRETGVVVAVGDFLAKPTIRELSARLAELSDSQPRLQDQPR